MLVYKQALRGSLAAGREKEGELATMSLEFEYLHGNLLSTWWKSDNSVNGELQEGNWRWNSISTDIFASSPSFSHPARLPGRPGELA